MSKLYKFGKADFKNIYEADKREWVMSNGIGGYASGSIVNSGFRKHHGYLIYSKKAPVERFLVLTRTTEQFVIDNKVYDFRAQRYSDHVDNGYVYLDEFTFENYPTFTYRVLDTVLIKKIAPDYGHNTVAVTYEVKNGSCDSCLFITPMFNYRDHGEVSVKTGFNMQFDIEENGSTITLSSKKDGTKINFYSSMGEFIDKKDKFSLNHVYDFEIITGDDRLDDHYEPKMIKINLKANTTVKFDIICSVENIPNKTGFDIIREYDERMNYLVKKAGYQDEFANKLVKASDMFISYRESTKLKTVLAGLPWFTDWGRDTMIAYTGLVLVTKRFDEAREILLSFAKYEKDGLIPNMFPDNGSNPIYNTVDASLWYINSAYQYVKYTNDFDFIKDNIYPCLEHIVENYRMGTLFNIGMDDDCLIHAGSDLDQITWMDVRVNDIVVTPRHGKPVEINALWYNGLKIMEFFALRFGLNANYYKSLAAHVKKSFNKKFYNDELECLYDVVDPYDDSIRPNQIYALSLPFKVLDKEKGKKVVQTVYKHLYNGYGLRSLSSFDKRFKPMYIGKLFDRDMAYHMGTTWGFLIGGFIDAYTYVNDYSLESIAEAKRMLKVFESHMNNGCINGISEIFDGLIANEQRGCFTQAWSVGEVLRAYVENVINLEIRK